MDFTRGIDDVGPPVLSSAIRRFELRELIDYVMTCAPPFSESSLIICPLNALFDWPKSMPSGYALFRDSALNAQLKRVLNIWCGFLSGPYSRTYLNTASPDGWFCAEADRKIGLAQFLCDPQESYWGFASWNGFFTRQFRPNAPTRGQSPIRQTTRSSSAHAKRRPITSITTSSSTTSSGSNRSRARGKKFSRQASMIWRKEFVGGSVYQAYLSAYNYHR